ncbi:MAG: methyltransferase domain-containing protein [Phycisphaerae bacterium]
MEFTLGNVTSGRGGRTASEPDIERSVISRYARAAEEVEPSLCCPSADYDAALVANLPEEIIEKDYGCGDPSAHVREGDTVVDLGSGSGKICYMLSQRVGPHGQVVGVDFNDAMLALARKYQDEMAERIGHANVRFIKARIQDMALDIEQAERWLQDHPITTLEAMSLFQAECARQRLEEPAVANDFADVVVSNCVLNLVRPEDSRRLFADIFRVLKRGGRVVISDIVCDEDPPQSILDDPALWSGCIAGAFREDRFLKYFEQAGFYGVEILARQETPWQVIDGIEFRSVTVRAFKGKDGPCLERNQAVIYKGPWKAVRDDDGHTLHRGKRTGVCDKTFGILTDPDGPYGKDVIAVPPIEETPIDSAGPFDCKASRVRDPRETKGRNYRTTRLSEGSSPCEGDGCC